MKVTDNDMPDDLLAKYLKGHSTPDEGFLAEEWINTSDANREYYERFKIKAAPDNDAEAWIRLQNLISKNHSGHVTKTVYRFKARWIQLIVTIVLIGLISYFIRTGLYLNVMLNVSSGANVVHDDLPDGTVFTLNTNSQLSYPGRFTGNKRSVNLNGEAFFEIKRDSADSFIINIKNINISTTSASVNVKSRGTQTEITVINGNAIVSSHGKALLLNTGEKMIANADDFTLIKELKAPKNKPAWAVTQ
jgi:transmembrane sensor